MKRSILYIPFIFSLCFLFFVLGAASFYFDYKKPDMIHHAFESYEAFQAHLKTSQPAAIENFSPAPKILNNSQNQGFTLYHLRYQNHANLIDNNGKVLQEWHINFRQAFPNPAFIQHPVPDAFVSWDKAHLLPNGDLIVTFIARGDTPYGYGIAKIDKNSNVIWAYPAHAHHDFYIDQTNGHIFVLTHEFVKQPIAGLEFLTYPMLTDFVVELSDKGEELRKVRLLDAFVNSPYKELANRKQPYGKDKVWDQTHSNSIMKLEPDIASAFPMFNTGQLLISVRNLDTLAVLDMDSGSIVWAYNGPWRAQHSVSFLASGNILLFDNRGLNNQASRVIEFDPKSLSVVPIYGSKPEEKFFSFVYGQVQRLPNGNTFINATQESRIFEINASGKKIWELKLPTQYARINPSLPPFEKNTKNIDKEEICPDYNLTTAIMSAYRYTPEQLPFLQEVDITEP